MVADFPRGGSNGLTNLEEREINDKVKSDLFTQDPSNSIKTSIKTTSNTNTNSSIVVVSSRKRKLQNTKNTTKNTQNTTVNGSIEKIKKIKLLNFKRIEKSMLLTGTIVEINEIDIVLSLPNSLLGYLSITEINDAITIQVEKASQNDTELPILRQLFKISQMLVCSVLDVSIDEPKRIDLTINPAVINASISQLTVHSFIQGYVESVQDYGYIIQFGIQSTKGFLLNSEANDLVVGQTVSTTITRVDAAKKVAHLSLSRSLSISAEAAVQFKDLVPGLLLPVKVVEVFGDYINVSFLGFTGTIPLLHLGLGISFDVDVLKVGQKFKARILYIDPQSKSVTLTRNQGHLLWTGYTIPTSISNGAIIDSLVIVHLAPKVGIYVSFGEGFLGFVHISKIRDERVDKISDAFKIGAVVRGRIIGFHYCDSIVKFSLQSSILSQPYLNLQDIELAALLKGTVVRVESFGVIVAVSTSIQGLCPSLYLSDAKISNPEKIFKVGGVYTFRVLSIDVLEKRLILTHKKSMLTLEDPILSYSNVTINSITSGVITAVKPFGCLITFFNNVRALVPISGLGYDNITVPGDHFHLGQSVKCQIVSVDASNAKMKATFKISHSSNLNDEYLGKVGQCQIVSSSSDGCIAKFEGIETKVFIPIAHLSDHSGVAEKLHRLMMEKGIKKPIDVGLGMIVAIDRKRNVISATLKGLVIDYASKNGFVSKIDQLEENRLIPGVISGMSNNLVFVDIAGITAAANSSNIIDGFLSKVEDYLTIGQTVVVNVSKIEVDLQRVYVTLKNSQLCTTAEVANAELRFLQSFFTARFTLNVAAHKSSENLDWVKRFQIGSFVKGKVDQIMPYGVSVILGSKVSGILVSSTTYSSGQEITCQIIDVDITTRIVDLKASVGVEDIDIDRILAQINYAIGKDIDGVVELVKDDYCVIGIKAYPGAFGYFLNHPINSSNSAISRYKLGQKVTVTVICVASVEQDLTRIYVQPVKSNYLLKQANTKRQLKNPSDPSLRSLEDLVLGKEITCVIHSVKDTQFNVRIADNLKGRMGACHVFENYDDIISKESPLSAFKHGQTIKCKVIGFHDMNNYKQLAISHQKPISQIVVDLSILPSVMAMDGFDAELVDRISIESIAVNSQLLGFVQRLEKNCIWVQISPSILGRIDSLQTSKDISVCTDLAANFKVGSALQCQVISTDPINKHIDLTLLNPPFVINTHDTVLGRIVRVDEVKGLSIHLRSDLIGRIELSEMNDQFIIDPTSEFKIGHYISASVLAIGDRKAELTLRKSKDNAFYQGQIVDAFVTAISPNGCFLSLAYNKTARVKIAALSDSFVQDWKLIYKPGQLVRGKIVEINVENNRIEMSLKQSDIDPSLKKLVYEDLIPKTIVSGVVKKIEKFGIFILLDNTNIRGLCHITELSDNPVKDIEKLYEVEDLVQAYILRVDIENRKISLSLKASRFDGNLESSPSMDDASSKLEPLHTASQHNLEVASTKIDAGLPIVDNTPAPVEPQPPIMLEGFSWDDEANKFQDLPEESADNSSCGEGDTPDNFDKMNNKARRLVKKERVTEEKLIAEKELYLLDTNQAPELAEDFERKLIGEPNNSYLWIKYMAFLLELSEIGKARQIVDRALAIIAFREEQERLNVLVAFLNLENKFGSPSSLSLAFDKACQLSDPKKIHIQLAKIYERCEQFTLAQELHQKMVKKFKESCKIWLGYAVYELKRNQPELARQILSRSLKSLVKRKHMKILSKFGQNEFKCGDIERGRTLFEGLLNTYPKKADLWSIYLDMETKSEQFDSCRRLFERILLMKWSVKKMKFFFKKYLAFEKRYGKPEGVAHVNAAALSYVQTLK